MCHMNLRLEITDSGVVVGLGVAGVISNSQCKMVSTPKTSLPPTPNKNQNRELTEESLPLGDCW